MSALEKKLVNLLRCGLEEAAIQARRDFISEVLDAELLDEDDADELAEQLSWAIENIDAKGILEDADVELKKAGE